MELQVGVKILLQNEAGEYLVLKRSADKYPEVGAKWDIVGGRINPGVSLLENLKREVFEETKLEIIGEPILIYAQDILNPDKHVVRLTYVGTCRGDVILDEENIEYQWLSLAEIAILEPLHPYFREALNFVPRDK